MHVRADRNCRPRRDQGPCFSHHPEDANIFDAAGRLQYIRYWEGKRDELDKEIKGVRGENLKGIHEELDQFAKIRATIDNLMDILGDMNTLTPEQHERSGFAEVLSALQKRLSE
ncbi:MAG TPA: hypothetical protein VJW55_10975 [Candidatus Angelobacter sp.]|nr:hypothetical protein [Candidatus Angelobacter sp.]